jgi:hypothetical protein
MIEIYWFLWICPSLRAQRGGHAWREAAASRHCLRRLCAPSMGAL